MRENGVQGCQKKPNIKGELRAQHMGVLSGTRCSPIVSLMRVLRRYNGEGQVQTRDRIAGCGLQGALPFSGKDPTQTESF